jgi:hypothetical protein
MLDSRSSSFMRPAVLAAAVAGALLASGCAMRDPNRSTMGASGEPMGGTSASTDSRQGGTPSTRGAMNPSSVVNPEGGSPDSGGGSSGR